MLNLIEIQKEQSLLVFHDHPLMGPFSIKAVPFHKNEKVKATATQHFSYLYPIICRA
jgi:hypothetical protein